MRITTLLGRIEKFKGFVCTNAQFDDSKEEPTVIVDIKPRANSKPLCSQCEQPGSVYDHQGERLFEYVPLLGFLVFFRYTMRRVNCRHCNAVKIEKVPWADGKSPLATTYRILLVRWLSYCLGKK